MTPILLVPFGARSPKARSIYDRFEGCVRERHPDRLLLRAYTATSLVQHLRDAGEPAQTLPEACTRLHKLGHHRAIAFSLHLVPGEKHRAIQGCSGVHLQATEPLLSDPGSIAGVARDLLDDVPQDRPVLVVAHGHATQPRHHAHLEALKRRLGDARPDILLRRLEGPEDESAWQRFVRRARTQGSVHIVPFLLVPGEHLNEDILGDHPESLQRRLDLSDVTCGPTLGERPWVQERFLDRLASALRKA